MARSSGYIGQVFHVGAIRMRVTGSGSLQLTLRSLDSVVTQTLTSTSLQATTNIEPTTLANFKQQRVQLRFEVTGINEYFSISRIAIFTAPYQTGYPQ